MPPRRSPSQRPHRRIDPTADPGGQDTAGDPGGQDALAGAVASPSADTAVPGGVVAARPGAVAAAPGRAVRHSESDTAPDSESASRSDAEPGAGPAVAADQPEAGQDPEPETGQDPEPLPVPAAPASRASGLMLPVALAAVAVVVGGLAVGFGVKAHNLHGNAAARNTALTDSATTSEVNGQVTSAVNTIFSYDYTNLDKTQQAAQDLLTGPATCQYNDLFKAVRDQAPKQKLVVTVTVTNSAVEMLQGDRARVLVFATQSDVRTTTNQSAVAGAMFAVEAVRKGGRWRIENIDTFAGAGPATAQPQHC